MSKTELEIVQDILKGGCCILSVSRVTNSSNSREISVLTFTGDSITRLILKSLFCLTLLYDGTQGPPIFCSKKRSLITKRISETCTLFTTKCNDNTTKATK